MNRNDEAYWMLGMMYVVVVFMGYLVANCIAQIVN